MSCCLLWRGFFFKKCVILVYNCPQSPFNFTELAFSSISFGSIFGWCELSITRSYCHCACSSSSPPSRLSHVGYSQDNIPDHTTVCCFSCSPRCNFCIKPSRHKTFLIPTITTLYFSKLLTLRRALNISPADIKPTAEPVCPDWNGGTKVYRHALCGWNFKRIHHYLEPSMLSFPLQSATAVSP